MDFIPTVWLVVDPDILDCGLLISLTIQTTLVYLVQVTVRQKFWCWSLDTWSRTSILISSLYWNWFLQFITLSPFAEQFNSKILSRNGSYFTSGCSPGFRQVPTYPDYFYGESFSQVEISLSWIGQTNKFYPCLPKTPVTFQHLRCLLGNVNYKVQVLLTKGMLLLIWLTISGL